MKIRASNAARRALAASILLAWLSWGAPAASEEAEAPADDPAHYLVVPHVGATVPQLFSDLGTWAVFGLELGYIVPVDVGSFERPLQLAIDVQYTQPSAEGTGIDADLGISGSTYDWELTQRMLILELTAAWRFAAIDEFLSPWIGLGPRVYLMESVLKGEGNGLDFGENRETKTEYGGVGAVGLDLLLGPGSLYGALEMGYSPLSQTITGESNTGALAFDLGYRFHF